MSGQGSRQLARRIWLPVGRRRWQTQPTFRLRSS